MSRGSLRVNRHSGTIGWPYTPPKMIGPKYEKYGKIRILKYLRQISTALASATSAHQRISYCVALARVRCLQSWAKIVRHRRQSFHGESYTNQQCQHVMHAIFEIEIHTTAAANRYKGRRYITRGLIVWIGGLEENINDYAVFRQPESRNEWPTQL